MAIHACRLTHRAGVGKPFILKFPVIRNVTQPKHIRFKKKKMRDIT